MKSSTGRNKRTSQSDGSEACARGAPQIGIPFDRLTRALPKTCAAPAKPPFDPEHAAVPLGTGATASGGLPGRDWFKHAIYAPGTYTGYGVKTLPGFREAVEGEKVNRKLLNRRSRSPGCFVT